VLAVALLLGASAPVWGGQIQDRRTREANWSPVDFVLPGLAGRLHQPNVCPLDFLFSQSGKEGTPRAAAAPAAEQAKGMIQDVRVDNSLLVLKDANGTKLTFFVAKDCKVFVNDKDATLSDLRKGDQANITYEMRGVVPLVAVEIRSARR
jgi:hypothetical protein